MTIALTPPQVRFLRGQAHRRRALLQVGGKGITASFLAETDAALERHELIKIKINTQDRSELAVIAAAIVAQTGCALVQQIGHTLVLYRPSQDGPQMVLPRP